MDSRLARRSRIRFWLARALLNCAKPIQWVGKAHIGAVSSIVAESRRQESIASQLWADAIAAGRNASRTPGG